MNSNTAELVQPVPADLRRFRLEHALQALENALILLDSRPAEAIDISALERVRDDLDVLLRAAVAVNGPSPAALGQGRSAQARRW
jgi:hypothetical protein